MTQIRKHLVPSSISSKFTYGGKNSKKYIVVHETDNTNRGANADAHSRLQYNGNSRNASWHYTVDDKEIVQSFSDDAQCYHAGNTYYNKNGIAIEICVNSDGNFNKAVKNAVNLVKHLMNKYKIPIGNVVQHNKASGKNCPRNLRSGAKGVTWNDFINMVKNDKYTPLSPTSSLSSSGRNYLKEGDKGQQVKELQEKLLKAGYKLPKYGADGDYGQETVNAVKELQEKHGLVVDGIFGEQSKKALEKELSQLKEDLTVSQAKELQRQIDELKKENQRLKQSIETKLDKPNTTNTPSNWAKKVWERITNIGYLDGTRPQDYVKREELSQVLERLIDRNNLK